MKSIDKTKTARGLTLTLLLIVTSMSVLVSAPVSADSARVTNNEEIIVSISSYQPYYDRDSSFTVSVMAKNLDAQTEYDLDWKLCYANSNQSCSSDSTHNTPSGSVDLGSGNLFTTATITFDDTGASTETYDATTGTWTTSGFDNGTYAIDVDLNVQGVSLDTNASEMFTLGGEGYFDDMDTENGFGNILLTQKVNVSGTFRMDHNIRDLLHYSVSCDLIESSTSTTVATDSSQQIIGYYDYTYFDSIELSPSNGGIHYVQCHAVRDFDSTVVSTIWESTNFEVINADITGSEEVQLTSSMLDYFDRSDSVNTVQISTTADFSNLFSGTEYTATWKLCYAISNHNCSSDSTYYTPVGSIDFTANSNTHQLSITFDDTGAFTETYDPSTGTYTISGFENATYAIDVDLNVQGVSLDTNASEMFTLGGEGYFDDMDTENGFGNILLTQKVNVSGTFRMDHNIRDLLHYSVSCDLIESSTSTTVATDSSQQIIGYYDYTYFDSIELSPSNGGIHYVQCHAVRDFDSTVVSTIWESTNFEVIDDTSNQDDATISITNAMTNGHAVITISGIDLDAGQGYSLEWKVTDDTNTGLGNVMIQNDHVWTQGNDGTHEYVLDFHDLADSTNACFNVVLKAGETEIHSPNEICWNQASTADGDSDNVLDPVDQCPQTPSGAANVQANGCTDSDSDGVDDTVELECKTDPNNANSVPLDSDNDGDCDEIDPDNDNDGYTDVIELLRGTDPFDKNSVPANQLPMCAVHYSLEVDGWQEITGEASIASLSPMTPGSTSSNPTLVVPSGNYYIIAICEDPDGDPTTVTINDIVIGPVTGEVKAAALVEVGEDIEESIPVTVTWTDGKESATTTIHVNLDGDAQAPSSSTPGFTALLGISAMLGAAMLLRRRID